ncbi:MAG TPA: DUF4388 domain-containing protein [Candidatus Obscuribacterales bacterium]
MFNVNKVSKQPVRLPALQGMPTEELIQQLLRMLQQNPGRTVVLPWEPGGESTPMCLTVDQGAASRDLIKKDTVAYAGDPEWVLYKGTEPEGEPIWHQSTGDLSFVLDRLLSELKFMGFDYHAMAPGQAGFGGAFPQPQRRYSTSSEQQVFQQPIPAPVSGGTDPNASGMNLSGNIRDVAVTNVLQSIILCRMVGKLEVNDTLKSAELYFEDGMLVHAAGQQSVLDENSGYCGDDVLYDLLTWEQGSFKFHSGLKIADRSVTRDIATLLAEGAMLRDCTNWLAERGFHMDATLMRVHPQLSESQFEQIVQQGSPLDLSWQKAVYMKIGNGITAHQIVSQMPMPRVLWMPIIVNFLHCQLVKIEEGTAVQAAPRAATAVQLDYAAMEMAYHELLRPETGMLSYPLFLFFLTQELARYKKSGMPFSVSIFELKQKRNGIAELLSNGALKQLAAFVEKSMEGELVYISHFGIVDFAMLLPCSISVEAEQMGEKLLGIVRSIELEGVDPSQLQFAIGSACVPDDCEDVEALLNLAVQRRRQLS